MSDQTIRYRYSLVVINLITLTLLVTWEWPVIQGSVVIQRPHARLSHC